MIERNLIYGVTTPSDPSSIGYSLEIKLYSYGKVRDDTICRTKGLGIMVYGSHRGDPASIVEGNYVEGSREEGGIVISGGPAIICNNVLVGNAYGGVGAQNYGGRDLQQNVCIIHNTIIDNEDSGINVAAWRAGRGNVIAFNALLPLASALFLRPSSPADTVVGNVICEAWCFVSSSTEAYDLWPSSNSPLIHVAGGGTEPWCPTDDFMSVLRGSAADVGAFEKTSLTIGHLVGDENPRPPRISNYTTPTFTTKKSPRLVA